MTPYNPILPSTLQSWVARTIVEQIVETSFYVHKDIEAVFLYWTDKAREYDGFDWDNEDEELGFWLHVVYLLCDHHYESGLWRDVKHITKILKENLHGENKNQTH